MEATWTGRVMLVWADGQRQRLRATLAEDVLVSRLPSLLIPEILSKRPFRTDFGEMTIEEVNNSLDKLSAVSKECIQYLRR
jgi:hypothetical protein